MEDFQGSREDGAVDDVEACCQLDLAPACKGMEHTLSFMGAWATAVAALISPSLAHLSAWLEFK